MRFLQRFASDLFLKWHKVSQKESNGLLDQIELNVSRADDNFLSGKGEKASVP